MGVEAGNQVAERVSPRTGGIRTRPPKPAGEMRDRLWRQVLVVGALLGHHGAGGSWRDTPFPAGKCGRERPARRV